MQTYSHLLLTAVIRHKIPDHDPVALIAGSIAPDIPLGLLSIGYIIDRRYLRPHLPDKTRCSPTYNHLYFNNPWWIGAHNIFHAPFPLLLLGFVGYLRRHTAWGKRLFWFAVGCGLHTTVDVFTHADDGPVLAFPFDWQTRFHSPISYWDPEHNGRAFRVFEFLLDLLLVAILIFQQAKGGKASQ